MRCNKESVRAQCKRGQVAVLALWAVGFGGCGSSGDVSGPVAGQDGGDSGGAFLDASPVDSGLGQDAAPEAQASDSALDGPSSEDSGPIGDGALTRHSYDGSQGSRDYLLYVPPGHRASDPAPLVLALHGCSQNAEDFSRGSRFNQLAAEQGFLVVYPEQSAFANISMCWNWFLDGDMHRGSGEPAILAGIVEEVGKTWRLDSRRIFVTGMSSGGSMAVVMGATYPELFAAVGTAEGCPYNGYPCLGSPTSESVGELAQDVVQAMGSQAELVPLFVLHGAKDSYVPKDNALLLVQQWLGAMDVVDDGQDNGSIDTTLQGYSDEQAPGGHAYTVKLYGNSSHPHLVEYWLVKDLQHAWSGGSESGSYTDPQGPDATREFYRFFSAHPKP